MSRMRVRATVLAVVVVAGFVGGASAMSVSGASDGSTAGTAGGTDAISADVALEVTVVNKYGNPVSDATLEATWDGGSTTRTTASNGKAFVSVPEGADVTIEVDHPSYLRNQPYVVEDATEREVTVEVALRGQATIRVVDASGPVPDATVQLYHDGQQVIDNSTGDDGRFTTPQIERGEYRLVTLNEGYLRNETTITVDGNVRHTAQIRQESVLVTFTVRDDHFAPPQAVANANVTIPGQLDVTTQGTGRVTVSVPVNDRYDVRITKPGYESVTQSLRVRESRTALNATISRTPGLNANTINTRIVVGGSAQLTVTDEYGAPVRNATVSVNGSTVGQTNANGVINVPIDGPGTHELRATKNGLETTTIVQGVRVATATQTPTPEPPSPTPSPTAVPTTATETTGDDGAGFGVVLALLALLTVGALARRRR